MHGAIRESVSGHEDSDTAPRSGTLLIRVRLMRHCWTVAPRVQARQGVTHPLGGAFPALLLSLERLAQTRGVDKRIYAFDQDEEAARNQIGSGYRYG
jgi:hypothetical protein